MTKNELHFTYGGAIILLVYYFYKKQSGSGGTTIPAPNPGIDGSPAPQFLLPTDLMNQYYYGGGY